MNADVRIRSTQTTAEKGPPRPRRVEDLEVFRLAHDLVLSVFQLTDAFPRDDGAGLAAELRRTAMAVPAHLAEGSGRPTRAEFRSFIGIAQGAAAVASYHLLLAKDLGHVSLKDYERLRDGYRRVNQMLGRLAESLSDERQNISRPKHADTGSMEEE